MDTSELDEGLRDSRGDRDAVCEISPEKVPLALEDSVAVDHRTVGVALSDGLVDALIEGDRDGAGDLVTSGDLESLMKAERLFEADANALSDRVGRTDREEELEPDTVLDTRGELEADADCVCELVVEANELVVLDPTGERDPLEEELSVVERDDESEAVAAADDVTLLELRVEEVEKALAV